MARPHKMSGGRPSTRRMAEGVSIQLRAEVLDFRPSHADRLRDRSLNVSLNRAAGPSAGGHVTGALRGAPAAGGRAGDAGGATRSGGPRSVEHRAHGLGGNQDAATDPPHVRERALGDPAVDRPRRAGAAGPRPARSDRAAGRQARRSRAGPRAVRRILDPLLLRAAPPPRRPSLLPARMTEERKRHTVSVKRGRRARAPPPAPANCEKSEKSEIRGGVCAKSASSLAIRPSPALRKKPPSPRKKGADAGRIAPPHAGGSGGDPRGLGATRGPGDLLTDQPRPHQGRLGLGQAGRRHVPAE